MPANVPSHRYRPYDAGGVSGGRLRRQINEESNPSTCVVVR